MHATLFSVAGVSGSHSGAQWIAMGTLVLVSCGRSVSIDAVGGETDGSTEAPRFSDLSDSRGVDSGPAESGSIEIPPLVLRMDLPEVEPSEEVYFCQNFANPDEGAERFIQSFASTASTGLHHLLLFYRGDVHEDGPAEPCSSLEFAIAPFGAQTPEETIAYPPGVAMQLPSGVGLRLQLHYINTQSEPVRPEAAVRIDFARAEAVEHHAGVLFANVEDILVPPLTGATARYGCELPFDMNLVFAISHMHRHGVALRAAVGDQVLLAGAEPSSRRFDPSLFAPAGARLELECDYQNDTGTPVRNGDSAVTDEMCIVSTEFYPLPPGRPIASRCE